MGLDGIESILDEQYPDMKVHFIRYADDFMVTAPSKEVAEEICELIRIFLTEHAVLNSLNPKR
jgi:RNA-directed DNA polymerase